MKKIFFLFSIFAIVLSCSSDDSADIHPLFGEYSISNVNWNTSSDSYLQNALEILKNNSAKIIISENGLGIIDVYYNRYFSLTKDDGVTGIAFALKINGSFNILDKTSENEYLVDVDGFATGCYGCIKMKDGTYRITVDNNQNIKFHFKVEEYDGWLEFKKES